MAAAAEPLQVVEVIGPAGGARYDVVGIGRGAPAPGDAAAPGASTAAAVGVALEHEEAALAVRYP